MKDIKMLDLHKSAAVDAYNSLPGSSDDYEEAVATLMAIKSITKNKLLSSLTKKEESYDFRRSNIQEVP